MDKFSAFVASFTQTFIRNLTIAALRNRLVKGVQKSDQVAGIASVFDATLHSVSRVLQSQVQEGVLPLNSTDNISLRTFRHSNNYHF
jgi:hypothetical protein